MRVLRWRDMGAVGYDSKSEKHVMSDKRTEVL